MNYSTELRTQQTRCLLAGLLLVTVIARGCVLLAMRDNLQQDRDSYRIIAENLLTHGVYSSQRRDASRRVIVKPPSPTAYRPPLYPILLTKITGGIPDATRKVAIVHFILGVATVALVYWLTQLWQLGQWGTLAALFVAVDPILLHWSTYVMTETLATFLAVVCLVCLTRLSHQATPFNAGLAGGVLALGILSRPTFLAWLVPVGLFILLIHVQWNRRLANLTAFLFVACLILAPWTVRNYRAFGRPIFATTHGGYTLLLGNNPYFYKHIRGGTWGTTWDSYEFEQFWIRNRSKTAGEVSNDEIAYGFACRFIGEQPGMFAIACAVRVGRLWNPLPHQIDADESFFHRSLRWAIALWYLLMFVLAMVGVWSIRTKLLKPPWVWGVLLLLAFTAVHAVYWSNMRMRAPLMPFVCIVAVVGIRELASRFWHRK